MSYLAGYNAGYSSEPSEPLPPGESVNPGYAFIHPVQDQAVNIHTPANGHYADIVSPDANQHVADIHTPANGHYADIVTPDANKHVADIPTPSNDHHVDIFEPIG